MLGKIVQCDTIFVNIPLIFTFSSGFVALELALPFWGHENGNEVLICSTENRTGEVHATCGKNVEAVLQFS